MFWLLSVSTALAAPNNQNAKDAIKVALHNAAGKPVDIDLTDADRLKVVRLGLSGHGITNLESLTNLPNLKVLWVHNNRLRNLSPVSKMKNMEALYLDHNQIDDLTPLANCTKLRTLYLDNNRPKELLPLANLKHLETLYI